MFRNNMLLYDTFDSCGSGTSQGSSKGDNPGIVSYENLYIENV